MFGKPTPKGWFEVEVRPNYNNPRKLKRILDEMFSPDGYMIQAEINQINKPRADAIGTKSSSKTKLWRWGQIASGLANVKKNAKLAKKAKEATGSKEPEDVETRRPSLSSLLGIRRKNTAKPSPLREPECQTLGHPADQSAS
ncbi:hypothetical protein MMYC01_203905 [Madurella mycetomatis]|uniref:Uncharacterized protein n=1 Tax=Madurella mycetomatis TaxID=100816 RepID=A0A175WB84_9PEZI|nr:hypothetical protein MMYC01_203905 [Madurella mycetomatis]